MTTYYIRAMEPRDISQVSQIEREAFPPPWPATNFKRELTSNSLTHYLVAYEEMPEPTEPVTEAEAVNNFNSPKSRLEALRFGLRRLFGGRERPTTPPQLIMGFAGLWFMADEAHLANIAVREAYRHQGMGERLLIASIELAIEHDARFFTLEVRGSNKIAQALYRKYGLIEVGTRRGYYLDNKEDAVIMTAEGITSAPYLKMLQNLKQAHAQRWGLSDLSFTSERK
jgi:ribosomal-protein-alanine N-acetyltransferase